MFFPLALQFLRHHGVAELFGIQVNDINPRAVLDFAFPKVMQARSPLAVLREIVRDPL